MYPNNTADKDKDRVVRVFSSSAFRSMHAERDHLVKYIFHQFCNCCELRGVTWGDLDLRRGVPTKTLDGETLNSWECGRQWIDQGEPFFVGADNDRKR